MRALGTGILSLWEDEDHWQEQRGWTISPRNLSRMIHSTIRSYLVFFQWCDIRYPGFPSGRHVDPLHDYGTTLHSENELTVLIILKFMVAEKSTQHKLPRQPDKINGCPSLSLTRSLIHNMVS